MSFFARAVFLLLVVATFFAFFAAQRLKSAPQVAAITRATLHFSPNGDDRQDAAEFRVRVREDDDVTATIVDADDNDVKRLVAGEPVRANRPFDVRWDGTTDAGEPAPEGVYRLRLSMRHGGRAVTLKPGTQVDLTAPNPTVLVGGPDGTQWITGPVAGRVPFRVRVVSDEVPTTISVLRTDLAAPREVARFELPPGVREGEWDGRAGGRPAPVGTYQVVALVRDQAGNVGRSAPEGAGAVRGEPGVSVRSLLVRPPADPVNAGEKVEFAVDSRGRPFSWRIARAGGGDPLAGLSRSERRAAHRLQGDRESGGEIKVRAPEGDSGVYVLRVRAGKDVTAVPFAVRGEETAPILVVLPAITWFGSDPLDDDRDGIPNTLERGGPADYPRLLAGGLPAGFGDVAALLAFFDEQHVRYDVTTDLTLAATRSGLTGEREGVVLAGPLRWVPTELARRLRGYASEGGRIASFGTDTLRRGVDVARDRLLRPLAPTDTDPFGARLHSLRRVGDGRPLQPVADEGDTGLLTGVEQLPGFTVLEESDPDDRVEVALALVDQEAVADAEEAGEAPPTPRPALTLSELGEGLVIRVGLPEWGARLAGGSKPVQQMTRNMADILRGIRPEIRSFR